MPYGKAYEPLRVTARFRTNPICDQWLPLDGLLWYQAHRLAHGPQQATLPGGVRTNLRGIHMPLKIINHGTPDWYFACSWAQPQPWWIAEDTSHWNKRFDTQYADLVDFGTRRGKVIVEQGKYRAYHMPVFARVAERVHWYCIGDRGEIEALLSTMTHIGKKASQGWGRVFWTVESWQENWSLWRNGELTRGVPKEDALELIQQHGEFKPFNIAHYGLRPSYYRPEHQRRLAVPG
jgi:CRISPR type IV-associated protein Csf3